MFSTYLDRVATGHLNMVLETETTKEVNSVGGQYVILICASTGMTSNFEKTTAWLHYLTRSSLPCAYVHRDSSALLLGVKLPDIHV